MRMDMLTGPQTTRGQRDELAELAGFHGLALAAPDVSWWDVDHLYCASGWASCPASLADVGIATAFGVKRLDLHPGV